MKACGTFVGILLAVHHHQVTAIINPRAEIFSKITTGERRYLKAKEETTHLNSRKDLRASATATDTTTLHQSISTPLKEVFRLTKMHGISAIDFNSTKIDSSELQRTHFMAEDGSLDAAYFLGLFYLYGLESLLPDDELAAEWFLRAAAGGHTDAQCALGLLLYHGHGRVKMDRSSATDYFRSASRSGNSHAHWLYGRSLLEAASSSQLTSFNSTHQQIDEAARLFALVADEIPEAAHQLAVMFEYGLANRGKDTDMTRFATAAELYESAAQRGYVESTYHLALMYAYGRGLSQDYVRAAELFRIAATHQSHSHPPSMRYLAIILANGYMDPNGIPDFDAALQLYEKCSSQSRFTDVQSLCNEEKESLVNLIDAAKAVNLGNNVNNEEQSNQPFNIE